jgi:hypothetical protein
MPGTKALYHLACSAYTCTTAPHASQSTLMLYYLASNASSGIAPVHNAALWPASKGSSTCSGPVARRDSTGMSHAAPVQLLACGAHCPQNKQRPALQAAVARQRERPRRQARTKQGGDRAAAGKPVNVAEPLVHCRTCQTPAPVLHARGSGEGWLHLQRLQRSTVAARQRQLVDRLAGSPGPPPYLHARCAHRGFVQPQHPPAPTVHVVASVIQARAGCCVYVTPTAGCELIEI